ncbi:UDP-N-acetyl glucosamine 2-epimerase [Photobacterium jeanii]|uniref:UDP-N-acetyl glucosamine 2-epimerase n=1 Tax=Photobacterium jeanii TaxID=858640 RepID=A0A178K899_9GAMM|nr:UDP-N-acetylglucosamine 2-epimerase [Photobacterium jeanii]OAN13548.1 UDP-N-acetyl glucosamine 2-epimerase [Photobacterium jeanii]PST88663.1 UDP-N-acetylglucosamine 2-epimerase (hydrolyzing) [Photobacterium jeanii]
MRKIAVFTGTRAEYGLLYWLMKDIQAADDLNLQLLVSGAHFSPEFGFTYQQIEQDGFVIDEKVETLLSSDSAAGVAKSIGLGVIGFTDALSRMASDALVILGDRFEALAAAQTAMILRIPVIHLHGGEISEGAYDDAIRHAISKLSLYHCTSMEAYRQRVIQLGEAPERVFNVGAVGLDHLQRSQLLSLPELSESLSFPLNQPYLLVTYHPVTLAQEPAVETFQALLAALDSYPEHQVILTYPNADDGGRQIIPLLEAYAASQPERVSSIPSLGQQRYLSAVKHAAAVIGNSSSGIIEVPSFDVGTVDIGARQQGRIAATSVIHCEPNQNAITQAIDAAISQDYKQNDEKVQNPYGQGNASGQIVQLLQTLPLNEVKTFYDLPPLS